MLPARVTQALAEGDRVVEVGVGARWDTLAALQAARPDLQLVATDVHARLLADPPAGVRTIRDDAFDPDLRVYRGAALIYAVRCPEELQTPLARLAREVDARLALRALKDEWADLQGVLGAHEVVRCEEGFAWRVWSP